jgi:hypothetical protein
MREIKLNYRKIAVYCLTVLSCFAFACDDDDDDNIITPPDDNKIEFENISLNGSNEVPVADSFGEGTLNATYNDDTNILTYTVTWTLGSVDDEVTGMHFHGPASTTENAPPVIPVTPSSTNYTGSYSASTRALTQTEEDDLKAGLWYFNIHSNTYPNGELRGQLVE